MSLEDAIAKLTAAVERNNELVEAVLTQAGSAPAGDEEKPKAKPGRKPKAEKAEDPEEEKTEEPKKTEKPAAKSDDDEGAEIDATAVRKRLADWLGEYAKEEDKDNPDGMHPEAKARKDAVKAAIKKLGGEKLTDIIGNQESVVRLSNWLDKKQEADTGFGKGRLAADPVAKADEAEDDDI